MNPPGLRDLEKGLEDVKFALTLVEARFEDLKRAIKHLIRAVIVLNMIMGAAVATAWLGWTFREHWLK